MINEKLKSPSRCSIGLWTIAILASAICNSVLAATYPLVSSFAPIGSTSTSRLATGTWDIDRDGAIDLTWTATVAATNAGSFYANYETIAGNIDVAGFFPAEFDNPELLALGGVSRMQGFSVAGRGPVTTATGTYHVDWQFSRPLPMGTTIFLSDPGAAIIPTKEGPFTYVLAPTLGASTVPTSAWTIAVDDPYLTLGTSTTTFDWSGSSGTLTIDHFSTTSQFPDRIVLFHTRDSFDHISLTVSSLPFDNFAFGMVAQVPEPSSLALVAAGLTCLLMYRFRRDSRRYRVAR